MKLISCCFTPVMLVCIFGSGVSLYLYDQTLYHSWMIVTLSILLVRSSFESAELKHRLDRIPNRT